LDNATGQQVTLIGTAHGSEKFAQQVKSILVELSASRPEGAGNMGTLQVVTVKDIQPPQLPGDVKPFQDVVFDIFINVARKLLTRKRMGGLQASGEFVEAI
jgi:hypothetical protein